MAHQQWMSCSALQHQSIRSRVPKARQDGATLAEAQDVNQIGLGTALA